MSQEQRPSYGWAMNFGKGYAKQRDIIAGSLYRPTNYGETCTSQQSDTKGLFQPPFYQLGPQPNKRICPFYNYTLPDTYPYTPSPIINPMAYWNLPYAVGDWESYYNTNTVEYQKPG
jgi:hypothetical protein